MRPLVSASISACFVHQRAARGVHQDRARLHARDALLAQEAARAVVKHQVHRHHVGARKQRVDVDHRDPRNLPRRAVIGGDAHAEPGAHARHLRADAAEPDHAQRLAVELHALLRRPDAGAHLAVHARDVARGGKHQRDRVLGHRDVAIALDGVHGDAARLELVDIHVARRAGAEEHDVLERLALRHQLGRHVGMVVEHDLVGADHARQIIARERRQIDVDFRVVRAHDLPPHRRELVVAVDEQRSHKAGHPPNNEGRQPLTAWGAENYMRPTFCLGIECAYERYP